MFLSTGRYWPRGPLQNQPQCYVGYLIFIPIWASLLLNTQNSPWIPLGISPWHIRRGTILFYSLLRMDELFLLLSSSSSLHHIVSLTKKIWLLKTFQTQGGFLVAADLSHWGLSWQLPLPHPVSLWAYSLTGGRREHELRGWRGNVEASSWFWLLWYFLGRKPVQRLKAKPRNMYLWFNFHMLVSL